MNKFEEMLIERIKKFSDKDKRDLAWSLLDRKTKKVVKTLINDIGVKSNE